MKTAFLFDLDGTLTRQELLPIIAEKVGLKEEMQMLTDLTMRGVIPFEASFRMRVAMLRSIPVETVRNAIIDVEIDPAITGFIKSNPENCFIATGNLHNWIDGLTSQLGCRVFSNHADEVDGRLAELSPLMLKSEPVRILQENFSRVIAIGDGANDVPMFEAADIGIAYGGAHLPFAGLIEIADYVVFESEALCRLLSTL